MKKGIEHIGVGIYARLQEEILDRRVNNFVLLSSPINGEGSKSWEPVVPVACGMGRFEWEYLTQFQCEDLCFRI